MFRDRTNAGQHLASKVLEEFAALDSKDKELSTVVVGVPSGGAIVAAEVAATLGVTMSLLVSKKISAPFEHELSLGAVSSAGIFVLNEDMEFCTRDLGKYIESEKVRLIEACQKTEQHLQELAGMPAKPDMKGKKVILIDDGVATGMTALAAIRSLRLAGAKQIVLATPLLPNHTRERLLPECDSIISLISPHGCPHLPIL